MTMQSTLPWREGSAPEREAPEPPAPPQLDADMAHLLKLLRDMGLKPYPGLSTAEARAQPTFAMAVRRVVGDRHGGETVPMELRLIPTPKGDLRARIYRPRGGGSRPLVLFFHGGGFVLGDLDDNDWAPRELARRTGAVVVSAHYRQAPEHRFPAAHEDAAAVWAWAAAEAGAVGGDPQRLALVGEGSGGNLALHVALAHRSDPALKALVLVTPMAGTTPDPDVVAAGLPFDAAAMEWTVRKVIRKKTDLADRRLAPLLRDDLAGLPPVTLILAEFDPCRPDAERLGEKLRDAGVPVDSEAFDGVGQGFFGLGQVVTKALFAEAAAARALLAAFT